VFEAFARKIGTIPSRIRDSLGAARAARSSNCAHQMNCELLDENPVENFHSNMQKTLKLERIHQGFWLELRFVLAEREQTASKKS
jgi:hypothetical protein